MTVGGIPAEESRIKHNKFSVHSGQRILKIPCPLFYMAQKAIVALYFGIKKKFQGMDTPELLAVYGVTETLNFYRKMPM